MTQQNDSNAFGIVTAAPDKFIEHLNMRTVFFSIIDKERLTARLIGSGVIVNIERTKAIFTAGHVLRDLRDYFADETIYLSLYNKAGDGWRLHKHMPREISAGGVEGADAGVLLLTGSEAATYFNFGNFCSGVGAPSIRTQFPSEHHECFIAGFPLELTDTSIKIDLHSGAVKLPVIGQLSVIFSAVVSEDALHGWLFADGQMLEMGTNEPARLKSKEGMSGGGCSEMVISREPGEWNTRLLGVHTATQIPRLRQTPIRHHLRLLASMSREARSSISRLWPEIELDLD